MAAKWGDIVDDELGVNAARAGLVRAAGVRGIFCIRPPVVVVATFVTTCCPNCGGVAV